MQVVIDGVVYVPRTDAIPDEARKLLGEVYASLWTEAGQDPTNESTHEFAKPLARKMFAANAIMRFRD